MRSSIFLAELGYDHYEVSNWSKTERTRSQHSSVYWRGNKDFLAYGMGAANLNWPFRITRPTTISNYFRFVEQLKSGLVGLDLGIDVQDESSSRQHLEAVLMSRIRLKEGVSWEVIKDIAGY